MAKHMPATAGLLKHNHMMVGMGSNLNLTCKAVLFDMDGTLVDSGVVVERAWGRLGRTAWDSA